MKDIFISYALNGIISLMIILLYIAFYDRFLRRYGARWLEKLIIIFMLMLAVPVSFIVSAVPLPRFEVPLNKYVSLNDNVDYSVTVRYVDKTPLLYDTDISNAITPENSKNRQQETEQHQILPVRPIKYDVTYHNAASAKSLLRSNIIPNLKYIWLSGIFAILTYQCLLFLIWKKRTIKSACLITNELDDSVLSRVKSDAGHHKDIYIYRCRAIKTPMTAGVFRPVILLPDEDYSESTLQYILAHEISHLKRKDPLKKLLFLCAAAIHWYNPFVWLLKSYAGRILELACDEDIVLGKPAEYRVKYSEMLLSEVKRTSAPRLATVNCLANEKITLKQRFAVIFSNKTYKRGKTLLCVLIAAVLLATCLFSCNGSDNKDTPDVKEVNQVNDSLKIYYYPGWSQYIEQVIVDEAIKLYKQQYPDIKVEVYDPTGGDTSMSTEMISKKIQTDIMAGKGPDIIIDSYYLNLDLYKMVSNGMIADLTPFLEKDENFDMRNYHENVIKSYSYNGKQYGMPIYWDRVFFLTTRENLERNGFSIDALSDVDTFLDELCRVMKENGSRYSTLNGEFIYDWSEVSSEIDFENKKLNLVDPDNPSPDDDPYIRRITDINSLIARIERENPIPQQFNFEEVIVNGVKMLQATMNTDYNLVSVMQTYKVLFAVQTLHNQNEAKAFMEAGEDVIIIPMRTSGNNLIWGQSLYAFMLNNSQNKENAYNFISIMLGDKVQSIVANRRHSPVLKGFEEQLADNLPQTNYNTKEKYIEWLSRPGFQPSNPMFRNSYTILEDIMQPYYDGEKTFEQCAKEARQYFEIYFSE